jgi:hypothetical protein
MVEIGTVTGVTTEMRRDSQSSLLCSVVLAVVLACIANGLSIRIAQNVRDLGLAASVEATFGISVIGWFSIYNIFTLLINSNVGKPTVMSYTLVGFAILCIAFPMPVASWTGLMVVSIYFLTKNGVDGRARRAFFVALGMCFTFQWAQWISAIFLPTILEVDATLVSLISGHQRYGNLVQASNGVTLEILAACSSFVNVSLTFLAWINARSYYGTHGIKRGVIFLSIMIFIVVLINTLRIAFIAIRPDLYDLIHGEVGSLVANSLSTIVIVALSIIGARK